MKHKFQRHIAMDNNPQKKHSCPEKVNMLPVIDSLFSSSLHRYFLFFVTFILFLFVASHSHAILEKQQASNSMFDAEERVSKVIKP